MPTLKTIAKVLGYCVYVLVVVEVFAALYSLLGLSRSHYTPDYLAPEQSLRPREWLTEREPWGTWHRPNTATVHITGCFMAHYRSNSYGARDRERSRERSGPRYVVLGDSFVEGWGVEEDQRLTNILERRTGREFLNFGASGDFATANVIAHEIGHHVQTLLGVSDQVAAARRSRDERESNAMSVKTELQADCLAGVWAYHTENRRTCSKQATSKRR